MVAKEADKTIEMEDLPVIMIYFGENLDETILNVSQKLDGEFTERKIQAMLSEFITKP
jgi:hypothetical protein